MKARNLLMIFALVIATGAACSSSSTAERTDETAETQDMAQTKDEATDQAAGDETVADADAKAEPGAKAQGEGQSANKKGTKEHCPMAVENTEVAVENTDNGVAMVFTTTGDVSELRERVQWKADHHGKMKGHGKKKGHETKKGHEKMHGKKDGKGKKKGHDKHAMMAKSMPATSVSTEEIDQGIKLVFTAEDDTQVQKLQQHIAQHVEQVNAGTCPMKYNKSKKTGTEES